MKISKTTILLCVLVFSFIYLVSVYSMNKYVTSNKIGRFEKIIVAYPENLNFSEVQNHVFAIEYSLGKWKNKFQ